MIKIDLTPIVAEFEAARAAVYPNEVSGLGFVRHGKVRDGYRFLVYDWTFLDVGTYDFTVISSEQVLGLRDHPQVNDLRIWLHSHPVGNGIPGLHNWSQTDQDTIMTHPLGGPPELIKWSLSAVRTPKGWAGRLDNYVRGITDHLEVKPDLMPIVTTAKEIKDKHYEKHTNYSRETFGPVRRDRPDSSRDRRGWNWFRSVFGIWEDGGEVEDF